MQKIKEIPININSNQSIVIYGDNIGAQYLEKNPSFHGRCKHIDVKNQIELRYLSTYEMIADILRDNI